MSESVTVVCARRLGAPAEVATVEKWELPQPGPNDVLVRMKAAPINPADLNVLEGKYVVRPELPAVVGNEGVGIVEQCGNAVKEIRPGQFVIAPNRIGSWCEAYVEDASRLIPLPADLPVEQAAMLAVNPPTAWRMLEDFAALKPGEWVIQNAANSAVGRFVIQIARYRGLRTLNVVRRRELIDELRKDGADVVVTDETPLSKQVKELTGGAPVKVGLNAVGGESARQIAKSLAPQGTLVTYGAMAREPIQIDNALLIYKGIRFLGFMITAWYQRATRQEIEEMFNELVPLVRNGTLKAVVERTYPLTSAKEAIGHASRSKRSGKILFVMN